MSQPKSIKAETIIRTSAAGVICGCLVTSLPFVILVRTSSEPLWTLKNGINVINESIDAKVTISFYVLTLLGEIYGLFVWSREKLRDLNWVSPIISTFLAFYAGSFVMGMGIHWSHRDGPTPILILSVLATIFMIILAQLVTRKISQATLVHQ